MKKFSCDEKFEYLEDYQYFTYEELNLVIRGWGDNDKTYDIICYVRYGMDFQQIVEKDDEMWRI